LNSFIADSLLEWIDYEKYDIAAFIWPSYTGDEPRTRISRRRMAERQGDKIGIH